MGFGEGNFQALFNAIERSDAKRSFIVDKIIKISMCDNHLEINLNRERVYNALNRQAKLELIEAIKNTESNKNIKSIIITASGKAFCTGRT